MKIRSGFVSNSSSTSFIIAYKCEDVCSHCGRSGLDLLSLVENGKYSDTEVRMVEAKKILKEVKSWEWMEEEKKMEIHKMMSGIKPSERIIYCDISWNDEVIREYINGPDCRIIYRGES